MSLLKEAVDPYDVRAVLLHIIVIVGGGFMVHIASAWIVDAALKL